MKRRSYKPIASLLLIIAASCNEPETVVTNVVHRDGSITRAIEMKSTENNAEDRFRNSVVQVPFDNTWSVIDSCEISEKGDTTWVRRAVKLFKNVNEINLTYQNDSGANRDLIRLSEFRKTFKWFNTCYRFSEKVNRKLQFGYPVIDFINAEELQYFYAPLNLQETWKDGADSLKYMAIGDSVETKLEKWTIKNLVSGWINDFTELVGTIDAADTKMGSLKVREDELFELITLNDEDFDSLWTNGVILREFIGESNYDKYKSEADTALERVIEQYFFDFNDYSVMTLMPGIVTATNGFRDTSGLLIWTVQSDFFLTDDYEMWAESKIPNWWAWIVSSIFLAFVFSGIIIKGIRKG